MRGKADSHDISFLQQVYSILGQRFRVSNPLKLALLTGIRITGIIISSVLRSKTKASPLCVGSSEKPPCCPLLSNVPLRVIPPVLHPDSMSNGVGCRGSKGVCSWLSLIELVALQASAVLSVRRTAVHARSFGRKHGRNFRSTGTTSTVLALWEHAEPNLVPSSICNLSSERSIPCVGVIRVPMPCVPRPDAIWKNTYGICIVNSPSVHSAILKRGSSLPDTSDLPASVSRLHQRG